MASKGNETGTAQPLALGGIKESEGSSDSQQAFLGSTPKPNYVHYDPVNPWQNPANGFAPLSGFTFTLPGATVHILGTDITFGTTVVNAVPVWQSGSDYPQRTPVSYNSTYWTSNGPGSGSQSPGSGGACSPIQQDFIVKVVLKKFLGFAVRLYFEAWTTDEATYPLPLSDQLYLIQLTVDGGKISHWLPQHTWDPDTAPQGPNEYLTQTAASVVNAANVPLPANRSALWAPGVNVDLTGFVLEYVAPNVNRMEAYFSIVSSLLLPEAEPARAIGNLDAHKRMFYDPPTGQAQWVGTAIPYASDYVAFAVNAASSTGTTFGSATDPLNLSPRLADSHDAPAGLFALAAYRAALYGGATGKQWMDNVANIDALQQALMKNVCQRRRGINESTAYGSAHGWPQAGAGKKSGPILTWRDQWGYTVDNLSWNPDHTATDDFNTNPLLRKVRFRCTLTHNSAPASKPAVGAQWTAVWAGAPQEALPCGYLTETFQANLVNGFLQTLDAIEAFAGLRAIWQLWTYEPWASGKQYRRCDLVTVLSGGEIVYTECIKPHTSGGSNGPSGPQGWLYWRSLGGRLGFAGQRTEDVFVNGALMRQQAATLASWCHPEDLLLGIRVMFKRDQSDANSQGQTHWCSVRYDANRFSTQNGVAEVNNLEHWYPDFLALPYLVVYDVPLADLLSEHNSLIAQAFDLATQRAPQFWWSRNFSTKPPAAYAAALMRMQDPRGTECVRFIKQHWVMETDKPKNFELVWLTLAEKSLKEPFPR